MEDRNEVLYHYVQVFSHRSHPDFFDVCKNHLNSKENLSGIPDIENSEIDEHLVVMVQYCLDLHYMKFTEKCRGQIYVNLTNRNI